jgi:hypothetical protein
MSIIRIFNYHFDRNIPWLNCFYKNILDVLLKGCLNKLFVLFIIFGLITKYKFIKIHIKTPHDVYHKIDLLKLNF